jgi:hypothetical protein
MRLTGFMSDAKLGVGWQSPFHFTADKEGRMESAENGCQIEPVSLLRS